MMTWEEWQRDADARTAGVFAEIPGTEGVQIGRANWMQSALPYAPLLARRAASTLPVRTAPPPAATGRTSARLPLEGYTVVDMTNVLAGPSCTRMFVELGAAVTRVDVMDPQHPPAIHVLWSGENSVGKRSIILERRKPEGLAIIHQITGRADIVCCNMMDDQMGRLGVDAASLAQRNPRAIGLQITATRGERHGPRHHDKGYDPSIQGTTGVDDALRRAGDADLPRLRLGRGLSLRLSRHALGRARALCAGAARRWAWRLGGDLALQRRDAAPAIVPAPGSDAPASARGQLATGMTAGERVYQLSDGWIFAQAPRDITAELGRPESRRGARLVRTAEHPRGAGADLQGTRRPSPRTSDHDGEV